MSLYFEQVGEPKRGELKKKKIHQRQEVTVGGTIGEAEKKQNVLI